LICQGLFTQFEPVYELCNLLKGILQNLDTFLNEHFHENWGQKTPRFWRAEGRFQIVDENHFNTANPQKTGGVGF
jgi:hypothetical protein